MRYPHCGKVDEGVKKASATQPQDAALRPGWLHALFTRLAPALSRIAALRRYRHTGRPSTTA